MTKPQIRMYGALWCPDCRRAKQFLDARSIPFEWHDIDQDEEARAYVEGVNNGNRSIPTIVFPDGSILVEPSNAELGRKLGVPQ
ncbi:MAG: mycoredoxin [Chloroflexi bacterium]|nr:mycoredoxin [Chloroflexota bacterium]